jgi:hypothetical protein
MPGTERARHSRCLSRAGSVSLWCVPCDWYWFLPVYDFSQREAHHSDEGGEPCGERNPKEKSGMIGEEIQAGRVRESPGCGGGTSLKGTPSTNIRTVADTGGA